MNASSKKTTATMLAIFLGGLGVHELYLGRVGRGVLMLLFSWSFVPAIIGLIQGLRWASMSEEKFAWTVFGEATISSRCCHFCGHPLHHASEHPHRVEIP
jgi:TM2 domain-containing membrane protein YozV